MCMPCATPFSFQIWEGWYKLLQTCQSLVKSKLELPSTSLRLAANREKKSRKVRCGGMPDIEIPSGKCHQCTCTWNSGHCISIFLYITTNQWSHYLREGILCFCKIVFFFSFRKSMEEDGNQGLLCWGRVYKETPKVWEVYQTNGEIFLLKQCQYALTHL